MKYCDQRVCVCVCVCVCQTLVSSSNSFLWLLSRWQRHKSWCVYDDWLLLPLFAVFTTLVNYTLLALHSVLFCSLAVLDPMFRHTINVLSPFNSVLCHSDWLFHGESGPRPRIDVVYPGRAWSSSRACTWHYSLHYLFLVIFIHRISHGWNIERKQQRHMNTTKIYGKTYKDHNLRVARYLLITFWYNYKIHTTSLNSYPCRTSESSFTALATNMLHSLFSDTLILPKNLHLLFSITDSAGKQLNISRHVSTTSWD